MRVVASILAALAAAGGIVATVQARQDSQSADIVVDGQRDQKRLQGGEWRISLSRSYHYGAAGDASVTGRDSRWNFCLADSDVEPLMRKLVGEGRTASSGTTSCSPLVMTLGGGKLRAIQNCSGGSVLRLDDASKTVRTMPARSRLTVTGRYGLTKLTVEFDDRRSAFNKDPDMESPPDGQRWSIKGERIGACQPAREPAAPASPRH
ncbi:hypothetical protein AB2M62_13860 [Sphingomonas sp. MMS12-HWE2-04]|uniref:hypothetical protein n=1 Tax=Sphingomonas sp. MMS12-HWE2-04 TaxID=3234199 RepID=UPI00385129E3